MTASVGNIGVFYFIHNQQLTLEGRDTIALTNNGSMSIGNVEEYTAKPVLHDDYPFPGEKILVISGHNNNSIAVRLLDVVNLIKQHSRENSDAVDTSI